MELRFARETITDRQHRFFKAVADDDRNAALHLVDPEMLQNADMGAVWIKCRMAAGLLKMAGAEVDSFRIESIDVAADRLSARVWMKLLKKTPAQPEGTWEDVPPAEWRQVQGEWYLHPEPRQPRTGAGERGPRHLKPLVRP